MSCLILRWRLWVLGTRIKENGILLLVYIVNIIEGDLSESQGRIRCFHSHKQRIL